MKLAKIEIRSLTPFPGKRGTFTRDPGVDEGLRMTAAISGNRSLTPFPLHRLPTECCCGPYDEG